MLWVDPDKYKRPNLTAEQREFLLRVVPLAGFLQTQTLNKALITQKPTKHGIFTSVLSAHLILKSNFGTHPVAQSSVNSSPANNLALLESHRYWKKTIIEYGGKSYRGYKNWRDFAVDFSDTLAWHDEFRDVLRLKTPKEQISVFAAKESDKNVTYFDRINELIIDYGLWEFDYYAT